MSDLNPNNKYLLPTAEQAKVLTEEAIVAATKTATDALMQAILTAIDVQARTGQFQLTFDYSAAGAVNIEDVIHTLSVDLKYRVAYTATPNTLLIDWAVHTPIAPPSKPTSNFGYAAN